MSIVVRIRYAKSSEHLYISLMDRLDNSLFTTVCIGRLYITP